jgi:hypothetical protein
LPQKPAHENQTVIVIWMILDIGNYLLVMNLVTQESGPQKGTDSQTGILKGHPERFCVVMCACEARGIAGIKKPGLSRADFLR